MTSWWAHCSCALSNSWNAILFTCADSNQVAIPVNLSTPSFSSACAGTCSAISFILLIRRSSWSELNVLPELKKTVLIHCQHVGGRKIDFFWLQGKKWTINKASFYVGIFWPLIRCLLIEPVVTTKLFHQRLFGDVYWNTERSIRGRFNENR